MENVKTKQINPGEHTAVGTWILIADAHLAALDDWTEFRAFLRAVESAPADYGVVFLGDIFDLWLALPFYESSIHRDFLDWCAREKMRRAVWFVEGNHEFFQSATRRGTFSQVSDTRLLDRDLLFAHGDTINAADRKYRFLRLFLRNPVSRLLLRLTGPFFGPALAARVRRALHSTNQVHKKTFPESHIPAFLAEVSRCGGRRAFVGHFHETAFRESDAVRLTVLPAYAVSSEIALFHVASDRIEIGPWRSLFSSFYAGTVCPTQKHSIR